MIKMIISNNFLIKMNDNNCDIVRYDFSDNTNG